MALLDLNQLPDDGDDPNEVHPEGEHGGGPIHEAQMHPPENPADNVIDLNIPAVQDEEQIESDVEDDIDLNIPAVQEDVDQIESDDESNQDENEARSSKKNLTDSERQQIYEALLSRSTKGKLKRNSTTIVAEQFNVSRHKVQRVWDRVKLCRSLGIPVDVRSKKVKVVGRKRMQVDLNAIRTVPLDKRRSVRKLGKAIGVSKSSLHRWFKNGLIRRHSSTLKPLLKESNKKERLRWCISMLDQLTLPHDPKFVEMSQIIHIDEKWFNATKKNSKFHMLPDEEDPHRTVHNKNSIGKVMFLAGVSMPIEDEAGNEIFDGKIGIWPFIRKEPAKRRSRNRPAGTLVTKTVNVDRDISRSFLITKVLPAIKARWPREHAHKTIWIQQDNARTHVPVDDEQFAMAVQQTGLVIRLMNQPPNSPDMNCLDLGFFASLQSLTDDTDARTIDELIENVLNKFQNYDSSILKKVFITLQGCLIEVMKNGGGNRYKIPHMNKDRLEALGILPRRLSCDRELYESVIQSLAN